MGTRTVFSIMVADHANPVCILFANFSHPDLDPVALFETVVENGQGRTEILEYLLGMRYETDGGNHRAGDRVYAIVDSPFGDYEFEVRLCADDAVRYLDAGVNVPFQGYAAAGGYCFADKDGYRVGPYGTMTDAQFGAEKAAAKAFPIEILTPVEPVFILSPTDEPMVGDWVQRDVTEPVFSTLDAANERNRALGNRNWVFEVWPEGSAPGADGWRIKDKH